MFAKAFQQHLQNKELEGGVHEGLLFTDVSLEKTTNGTMYIRFSHESPNGRINAKEFQKTTKNQWQTQEQ